MVRVWYEPPPYGPGTDLNRTGYGVKGGGISRTFVERMSKMPQGPALAIPVIVLMAISYIPLSKFQ
jgi:hypothetical protein